MATIFSLIQDYQKKIGNLQWHLDTNKSFISEDERRNTIQRMTDFQNIIEDLYALEKDNKDVSRLLLTKTLAFLENCEESEEKTELEELIKNYLK